MSLIENGAAPAADDADNRFEDARQAIDLALSRAPSIEAQEILDDAEGWYARLVRNLPEARRVQVAETLLMAAHRLAFVDFDTRREVFSRAQAFGSHFLPVHFYSPIPDTSALGPEVFAARYDHLPGLRLDAARIGELFAALAPFSGELTKEQIQAGAASFCPGDAVLLYAMIRSHKPRRIVEIGSGASTQIGLLACARNGSGAYTCIEPYPDERVLKLATVGEIDLRVEPVQTTPFSVFEALEAGDILFIDSTHVVKTGSDVVHEFLQIVPRLKSGVIVHVHDIFLPFEYPRSWVVEKQIFWTEQYLLTALLADNPGYQMLIPNQAAGHVPEVRAQFEAAFPGVPPGGGSFWFRKA
jgi:predicted O-methyltransferase YrrM